MNEEYFQWLYSFVGKDTPQFGHYWRLLRIFYSREFYYVVKNDDNRATDGVSLRQKFANEYGYSLDRMDECINGPCRFLEMLVGLSIRINDELMWDPDKGDRTAFWFWTIVQNMGFDLKYISDEYFDGSSMIETHGILNRVMNRQYDRVGNGGLFPLRGSRKDQRKVEIWYQMNAWLAENYPLDPNKIE